MHLYNSLSQHLALFMHSYNSDCTWHCAKCVNAFIHLRIHSNYIIGPEGVYSFVELTQIVLGIGPEVCSPIHTTHITIGIWPKRMFMHSYNSGCIWHCTGMFMHLYNSDCIWHCTRKCLLFHRAHSDSTWAEVCSPIHTTHLIIGIWLESMFMLSYNTHTHTSLGTGSGSVFMHSYNSHKIWHCDKACVQAFIQLT